MDDLISKRALLRHLDMAIECKDCPRNTDGITYQKRCACSEVSDICNIITDFATYSDVQSVVHGKWIEHINHRYDYDREQGDIGAGVSYTCSLCNLHGFKGWHFCPNCGARMDLEENFHQRKDCELWQE